MRNQSSASTWWILLTAALCYPGCSRESQESQAEIPTLDVYDFVARGRMSRERGVRPTDVARMDNNGEILLACLEPVSDEELESRGVKFLRSQLELLVDWNLLDYDAENESYETTVNVFGVEKA